jgi:hypothetical protein
MMVAARVVSWGSLIALVLAPALFLAGRMDLGPVKGVQLGATFVWFVAAGLCTWKEEET